MASEFDRDVIVGENKTHIKSTFGSYTEYVQKMSWFDHLPTEGPNGEKDLVFNYRKTKEGHEYYSIVSKKAGMEYQFGQSRDQIGMLFGKGWKKLYVPEEQQAPAAAESFTPVTQETTNSGVPESVQKFL